MQRLDGDGPAFVHAGGTLERRELAPGQELFVDTGCLVAYTSGVDFDIQYVGKVKTGSSAARAVPRPRRRAGHGLAAEPAVLAARVARFRRRAPTRRVAQGSVLGGFAAGGLPAACWGDDGGLIPASAPAILRRHGPAPRFVLARRRVLPASARDRAVGAAAGPDDRGGVRPGLLLLGCGARRGAPDARAWPATATVAGWLESAGVPGVSGAGTARRRFSRRR